MNDRSVFCLLQIWDAVKQFDRYCTPGGGKDSVSVFSDAGLLFESSAASTPDRQGEASFSGFTADQIFCLENLSVKY